MSLSEQQKSFFETFGYLQFPGLLKPDIDWIIEEFTAIHSAGPGQKHDGTKRTCIVPFIDQSAKLCTLLDHPAIVEIASGLLGADFNYLGGDGNYYTGDTGWHSDGWHSDGLYIKMALYLDPVSRDTGCLRVVPGSHIIGTPWTNMIRGIGKSQETFGIHGSSVPAIPLESTPGDLVVFNHNLQHAAYGGGSSRRMFTLNLCRHAAEGAEMKELYSYIMSHDRFWIEHVHSDIMRATASPERMVHLSQIIENEGDLVAAARKAKERMTEPSRG